MTQVEENGHVGSIATAYVGGNMEHGLLHATDSSCWRCCCRSTLLLVEVELELLLLLCPSKAWSWAKAGPAYQWTEMQAPFRYIHEDEIMCTVHVLLYASFPTRNNQVLACVMDRLYTRAHVNGAHTTHTRIRHDHACMYSSDPHTHSRVCSCKTEERLKRLLSPCCCALQ